MAHIILTLNDIVVPYESTHLFNHRTCTSTFHLHMKLMTYNNTDQIMASTVFQMLVLMN